MKASFRYEIAGLVQGVGFRPWLYALALRHDLAGEVYNDDEGVKLSLYGDLASIKKLENALKNELPPLARIDRLKKFKSEKTFSGFKIIPSQSGVKSSPILPDFALCADCEREFNDPDNRRYLYPFINCTNCGPRFSIIKALPYDRFNTSMSEFEMCEHCKAEYESPDNRRYHAQPISCPDCGPSLSLFDEKKGLLASKDEAIRLCADLIKQGKIIAIKGLGGFHLICDALNQKSVNLLRVRKNRPAKPFALMMADINMAKKYAFISQDEERLLTSKLKPIVLLKSKLKDELNTIGIMLAYTGLHKAIFSFLDTPLIATSANLSGEPIISSLDEIFKKLGGVFDFVLDFNREIISPSDDSIAFVARGQTHFIRTSRGLNPKFISSKFKVNGCFLGLGAELKNSFAIYKDGQIMISPYIGDLKNISTFNRFKDVLELFVKTYELKFDKVGADLHPHFLHTNWAKKQGLNVASLQHHKAHLLAVLLENELDLDKSYLGFCFDGTGYGEDGNIWGGEVFRLINGDFKRAYHFSYFRLLGGEASISNIKRIAYSLLAKYDLLEQAGEFLARFKDSEIKALNAMLKSGTNSPFTSSLGRIFDAMGAIICGLDSISYEAQSGMALEALYDENIKASYEFEIASDGLISLKNALIGALKDEPSFAATAFINGLADLVLKIAKFEKKDVIFSGGVFQNRQLLCQILDRFNKFSIKSYSCAESCNNDSSVALGQLLYLLVKN